METKLIRVVLADDHTGVRAGIRRLLDSASDIVVVGEAQDGVQAIEEVKTKSPDVLVLDVEMPRMNGHQVVAQLQKVQLPVHVLVLSSYDDREYIRGMLESGVDGYLTKEEVPETLVKAVRGIALGEKGWVSRRVEEKIASWSKNNEIRQVTLTARELEVLRLAATKISSLEIAKRLQVSPNLIDKHLEILCRKLKATSRVELTVRAKQEGLI